MRVGKINKRYPPAIKGYGGANSQKEKNCTRSGRYFCCIDSFGCFYLQLLLGWPELPAADFRADLLAVGEVGFRTPVTQRVLV